MEATFLTTSETQTHSLGESLGTLLRPGDVVLLSGDLGAGKTQLTKGVARSMGVTTPVTSPTFPIMVPYPASGDRTLVHFDLYRVEQESMLYDVGYWESLESRAGEVSLVEWGDKFPDALPQDYLAVTFTITGDSERTLTANTYGQRSEELCRQWSEASAQ